MATRQHHNKKDTQMWQKCNEKQHLFLDLFVMDHSTFQFSISTDINSPFSHSARVARTLSSTASSYSRGPSSLIVAGMYVPPPAVHFFGTFGLHLDEQ